MRVRKSVRALAALAAAGAIVAPIALAGGGDDTVTISGRAYAFNHMDTYIQGAQIKVRELPGISATTDANGDYSLEVPDDTNVTPYIDPPDGYNQIDLQTFHTRSRDLHNANFQTPADPEYKGLAALLSVNMDANGRPTDCVIVTTASARDVRGVSYETFHQRTPHGVPGATSSEAPALDGPVYFNENVIPDKSKTATSEDGGIIWTDVPAGTYRISTTSPTTRFASFLATCAPGRIVNANPPWGAYELAPGEKPLGASRTAASVVRTTVNDRSKERRTVDFKVRAGEAVDVKAKLRKQGSGAGRLEARMAKAGDRTLRLPVRRSARRGKARLEVTLTDAAGENVRSSIPLKLPKRP
jgi:hypothetical protein